MDTRPRTAADLEASRKDISKEIEQGRQRVAKAEAKVAHAKTEEKLEDANDDLADARSDLHASELALSALNAASSQNPKDAPADGNQATHIGWPATMGWLGQEQSQTHPTFARIARHVAANPDLALYKMKNSAYKFAFMLVPISLPFLWVMFFWRKGVTMYDHSIFTLYGLSFLSLWLALIAVVGKSPVAAGLAGALFLFQPVHLFMQLKGTYALGWWAALWRTVALLVAGSIVIGLFAVLVLFISLE